MKFPFVLFLAFSSGFIALVYEILWARVYSFASASRAVAFGCLLGSYLLGLAAGALLSRQWQRDDVPAAENRNILARFLIGANLAAFLVVPAVSWAVVWTHWALTLPLVMAGSALLGAFLPLLCHTAIAPTADVGARLSYVYLANIIGSGAGSLLTGFLLFEHWPLSRIAQGLLLAALVVSFLLTPGRSQRGPGEWIMAGSALALALLTDQLHTGLYERLQLRAEYRPGQRFATVVESRHGVITVDQNRVIYGGGIYDGMIETDPRQGGGLQRPYFVSAVHPAPRKILVIGVSGGAWTQVLANHPQAEQVTAVDIDSGYLKIIAAYDQVSSLLENPKVEIVIDDGRRWLRRNPDRKFDVIVMNTTFHWREFASSLLGKEFLEMAHDHLQEGGIVLWNCTGSARAIATGMAVFPHTLMVSNNCLASPSPLEIDLPRLRSVLSRYRIDGQPVFDLKTDDGRASLAAMMSFADPSHPSTGLQTRAQMNRLYGAAEIITDDNLGEEYNFSLKKNLFLRRFFD